MSRLRTIVKNSLVTYASHAYEILVGILWFCLLGRYLGSNGLGRYALLYVFLQTIIAVSDSGVNCLLTRDIASDRGKAAYNFGATILIRVVVTFLFWVLLSIIFLALRGKTSWSPDWMIFVIMILFTVAHFSMRTSCTIFWAYERMEFESLIKVINISFMLTFLLFVRHWDLGLTGVFAALALSKLIAAMVGGIIRISKFIRPKFPKDMHLLKYYGKEGLPLGISAIVWGLYGQIDTIMLAILTNFTAVGLFNGAYRLIKRFDMLPILVNRPLFPAMSLLAKESEAKLKSLVEEAFKFIVVISLLLAILLIVFADKAIHLLLGNEFAGSVIALQILSGVVVLRFLTFFFGYVMVAIHKQRLYAYILLSSFAANVVLDLLLILRFGYIGACIANLLVACITVVAFYYFLSRHIEVPSLRLVGRPLLCGFCTALFLYTFKAMNVLVLLPSSIILYSVLLFLFRAFTLEEVGLLKKAFHRQPEGSTNETDSIEHEAPVSSSLE